MRADDLDFHLPPELIASTAAEPRDAARLLVVSRSDPSRLEHRAVRDLPCLLSPGDLLVTNDSRVVPARFLAINTETGGNAEGLWLRDDGADDRGRAVWAVLLKARRHRVGRVLALLGHDGRESAARLEILGRDDQEAGAWRVAVWDEDDPGASARGVLERLGFAPLPPYIRSARRSEGMDGDQPSDRDRYQTVYAQDADSAGPGPAGSVAAPTAGLHFTPGLLGELSDTGVSHAPVTLHVGTGTFKTVEAEDLDDHPMHSEWCSIPATTRNRIASARRVIAVGTTAARTLESFAAGEAAGRTAGPGTWLETDLLIQPGHTWRALDGLMTNFHLPRSTLLALVAALFPGGIDRVREIYGEAIRERYRFFSFGDAMLILP